MATTRPTSAVCTSCVTPNKKVASANELLTVRNNSEAPLMAMILRMGTRSRNCRIAAAWNSPQTTKNESLSKIVIAMKRGMFALAVASGIDCQSILYPNT